MVKPHSLKKRISMQRLRERLAEVDIMMSSLQNERNGILKELRRLSLALNK
jgi:hypothetical protein